MLWFDPIIPSTPTPSPQDFAQASQVIRTFGDTAVAMTNAGPIIVLVLFFTFLLLLPIAYILKIVFVDRPRAYRPPPPPPVDNSVAMAQIGIQLSEENSQYREENAQYRKDLTALYKEHTDAQKRDTEAKDRQTDVLDSFRKIIEARFAKDDTLDENVGKIVEGKTEPMQKLLKCTDEIKSNVEEMFTIVKEAQKSPANPTPEFTKSLASELLKLISPLLEIEDAAKAIKLKSDTHPIIAPSFTTSTPPLPSGGD